MALCKCLRETSRLATAVKLLDTVIVIIIVIIIVKLASGCHDDKGGTRIANSDPRESDETRRIRTRKVASSRYAPYAWIEPAGYSAKLVYMLSTTCDSLTDAVSESGVLSRRLTSSLMDVRSVDHCHCK